MATRYLKAGLLSFAITFGLLFVMQALVARDELEIPPRTGFVLDIAHVRPDREPEPTPRVPERPKPPEPTPVLTPFPPLRGVSPGEGRGLAPLEPTEMEHAALVVRRDSDVVPIVRVAPVYPPRLAARGIEGWVEVEFSIGTRGEVLAPRVTASSHAGFERAALRAIRGWRYDARIEDGRPSERHGVRVRLAFQLEGASA